MLRNLLTNDTQHQRVEMGECLVRYVSVTGSNDSILSVNDNITTVKMTVARLDFILLFFVHTAR